MMIRIKCDGKCRKVNQLPKTIEELRSKISELFGSLAAKLDINYKDCDGELVSVIDTEDLKNCVAEAEAYKMTCVTLLLKDGHNTSRSISSKKKSSESSESKTSSESDEDHGFATVGDAKASKAKAEEEAALLKQKLIEDHQKALAQLEQETKSKVTEIEEKKERRRRGGSGDKNDPKKQHNGLAHKVKSINRFCESENIENPLLSLKGIFKSVKEEFPALASNPELLNLVIKDCKDTLINTIKSSCAKVVSANPEVAKKSETNRAKFGEMNKEFGMSHCKVHKERVEGADRDQRRAERDERRKEKDAQKLMKDAEKAEKKANKLEEKQVKVSKKEDVSDQEAQIRAKVKALKEQFPAAQKPQLRAIVTQNPTLSPLELAPMIKASRIAKSSYK